MLVDLDVDAALAFLLVKIACADEADREDSDQDEKKISAHWNGFVRLSSVSQRRLLRPLFRR